MARDMTVTVVPDGDMLVSHCLDLDIASQGYNDEEAIANLKEAVAVFLEVASSEEVQARLNRRGTIRQVSFDLA